MEPTNSNIKNISEEFNEEEVNLLHSKFKKNRDPLDNILLILIFIGLMTGVMITIMHFYPSAIKEIITEKTASIKNIKTTYTKITNPKSIIELQQVNNTGYTFYLGKIDYPDSPPISDEIKNAITQVLYKSQIPRKILKDVAIIIVNSLTVTPDKKIIVNNNEIPIPNFPPTFLSGGGLYSQNQGSMSLIFINSKMICSEINKAFAEMLGQKIDKNTCYVSTEFLSSTLTHELAHHVGNKLTEEEWAKFYQLRNIPINTPRRLQRWEISPTEDFAEVYKNTFTGEEVNTYYGLLTLNFSFSDDPCNKIIEDMMKVYESNKPKTDLTDWRKVLDFINTDTKQTHEYKKSLETNPQVQTCRRDVLINLEKYPELVKQYEDYKNYQIPIRLYKSEVTQQTKDFIISVVNRLNRQ